MALIVEGHGAVAIGLALALADLSQRQFDLALAHAGNHLVRVDRRPLVRAPVLVEHVRIVVEEDLVHLEGVGAVL